MSITTTFITRVVAPILLSLLITHGSAQEFIDEDFLDNIEANATPLLNEPARDFATNITPAKWQDESAVIIGYSRSVLLDKKNSGGFFSKKERSLWFLEKIRLKIRLNDNNSVQAFSEIYFRYGHKEDGFIARIIKPDGSISNIDLKSAIGIEPGTAIPEFFSSFFDKVAYSQYKYYKVPVPNLEPGDILEYLTTTKSKLDVASSGYIEFAPNYELCSKKYPVMFNEIILETDGKTFFKSLSLNGAPEFRKENSPEANFFRYVFTDRDRGTGKDVNFVSPYRQFPLVKFQVIYSNDEDARGALIGEKGELKSRFSKAELAKKAWEDYEMQEKLQIYANGPTVKGFINNCWSELKKMNADDWTPERYTNAAYYLVRNKILFQNEYLSDKEFAYVFGSLLFQRDIPSELIITIGNDLGKLDDILFEQEISYVIKVGNKLYFNLTDYSNPGELQEDLLGNESYIIYEPQKKTKTQEIKPFTLPVTKAADNVADVEINTEISADMKKILVARTTSYTGIMKAKSIATALRYTPYMFDDYKNYGGLSPVENRPSREVEDYNTSVKAIREEYKRLKPVYVKEQIQDQFGPGVSNVRFNLVNDGRTDKKSTLVVKEGFELNDLIRRADKKYLLNLAGLMGNQLQVKEDERDRTYAIDVRYPKTYRWTINFKIPEGYLVDGLKELNKDIDNETGSFIMTAKEENGSVKLVITKVYKEVLMDKGKWNEMLAFIDAAYNTTFTYILLKPKP